MSKYQYSNLRIYDTFRKIECEREVAREGLCERPVELQHFLIKCNERIGGKIHNPFGQMAQGWIIILLPLCLHLI